MTPLTRASASAAELSVSQALENLALALGASAAIPRGDLVRALERAAERLRGRGGTDDPPTDLVAQAEAARLVNVSRQAVNQWIRKGTLRAYGAPQANGRGPLVSLAEVVVAANRWKTEPLSAQLRSELSDFFGALEERSLQAVATQVARSLESDCMPQQPDAAARVLREFLVAAMGAEGRQQEFTRAGVRMLAELPPDVEVDPAGEFGRVAARLGLLIYSVDGRRGFDSPSAAILGLLGTAMARSEVDGRQGHISEGIGAAARSVWGDEWVRRLFDAAFQLGDRVAAPLTRYTAALLYLGCNRFMRQAQSSGVSITYAHSPAALLPQSYQFQSTLSLPATASAEWSDSLPRWPPDDDPEALIGGLSSVGASRFLIFNFEHGLFDDAIHGIRRYCFSAIRAREDFQVCLDGLPKGKRSLYVDLVIATLTRILQRPYVEICSVEPPADFDWWKDHIIRSSAEETVIGLRGERARSIAHALVVPASMLPQIIEAGAADPAQREPLRLYVKNLDYSLIDERYRDDLKRGAVRMIKDASTRLATDAAHDLAAREVRRLLAGAVD